MSEFEKWFRDWSAVPFDDTYTNIERDSLRDAWNAALEAGADRVRTLGAMRKVWTPAEMADAISELKHTPEQSNG